MRPAYQLDFVFPVELLNDVTSKQVACASRTDLPAWRVIWIAPHEVAHGSIMGHFLFSVNASDLVERVDRRTQPAMHAEDFIIDDCCQSQVVEDGGAISPHVGRSVLAQALVVETVHLRDLSALMVAADQSNSLRVPYLEGEQQQKGLDRVVASVDEIAHKQIVGLWALATDLEQFLEVVELTVDITADLQGCKRKENDLP